MSYRLKTRNLFQEMDRLAFIAKVWSAGISIGSATSLSNLCRSIFGSALSSSSMATSRVSLKSLTCCTRRWTVRELASEVATRFVDTGIRLRG